MKKELVDFIFYLIDVGIIDKAYNYDTEEVVYNYLKSKEKKDKYMTKKP